MPKEFELKNESEFIQACVSGEIETVKKHIAENPSIIHVPASVPVLWFAASRQHWDVVRMLLEKGVKFLDAAPQVDPNPGVPALWIAANWQQWDVVRMLLERGARHLDATPQSGPDQGLPALWIAANWEQWDVVRILLEKGAKHLDAVPESGPDQGLPALWYAACDQQWDVVRMFLERGAKDLDASPQSGDVQGLPALWLVANGRQWDVVRMLLEKGVKDLDAAKQSGPYQGVPALWLAANCQQWDVVRMLLERGAKLIDAMPSEGPNQRITSLNFTVKFGNFETAYALLARGAALDKGEPLLPLLEVARKLYATKTSQHDKIRDLITEAEKLFTLAQTKNPSELTVDIIKEVIRNLGSALNSTKEHTIDDVKQRKTALQIALQMKNRILVEWLISAGAEIPTEREGKEALEECTSMIEFYLHLKELHGKVQALLAIGTNKEQKELKESLRHQIDEFASKALQLGMELEGGFKSRALYQLGTLLHQAMPDVDANNIYLALREVQKDISETVPEIRDAYANANTILHELMMGEGPLYQCDTEKNSLTSEKSSDRASIPGPSTDASALSLEGNSTFLGSRGTKEQNNRMKAVEKFFCALRGDVKPEFIKRNIIEFFTGRETNPVLGAEDSTLSIEEIFIKYLTAKKEHLLEKSESSGDKEVKHKAEEASSLARSAGDKSADKECAPVIISQLPACKIQRKSNPSKPHDKSWGSQNRENLRKLRS